MSTTLTIINLSFDYHDLCRYSQSQKTTWQKLSTIPLLRLLGLVGILVWPTTCVAQEELLTESPERVAVYGSISDQEGNGISNAEVTLVFGRQTIFDLNSLLRTPPHCFTSRTDADGRFEIELDVADPNLASSNHLTKETLLIQADGFLTRVFDIDLSRMMVRYPFNVQLQPMSPLELTILDASGQPIAGASVKPAIIGDKPISRQIPWYSSAISDTLGKVSLPGTNAQTLKSVYIETPSVGNQQVLVNIEEGPAIASMAKTGRIVGQIELDDDIDIAELAGTKLLMTTFYGERVGRNFMQSSWQVAEVDEQGRYACDHLAAGMVEIYLADEDSPFFYSSNQWIELKKADEHHVETLNLPIKILRAQVESIKITDEAGLPLAGIQISAATGSGLDVTDEEGVYRHRYPKGESLSGQVFLFDPLGRFQITDPFGIRLDRLSQTADESRSIPLVRSRSLRGIIIDEAGNRVPNATIRYSYPSGRFEKETESIADISGQFEIRNLPPATPIEISAQFADLATDPDHRITIESGNSDEIVLRMVRQAVAHPTGRIVDSDGNPVSGANVLLKKGNISQTEGFSDERLFANPLIANFSGVTTDDQGYFQYPAILDFGQRLQLVVEKPGYLTGTTPYLDGALRPVSSGQIDLGVTALQPIPERVTTNITIIDQQTNQPVPNAELVFLGILSGRQNGTANQEGTLTLRLFNTPQLIAARSPHHQIRFQFIDQVGDSLQIELALRSSVMEAARLSWPPRNNADYLTASQRLLDQLTIPPAKESTFYRQSLYFSGLAGVDMSQLIATLNAADPAYEYGKAFLQRNIDLLMKLDFESTLELIRNSEWATGEKIAYFSFAARLAKEEAVKQELYGEAAMLLGEISGSDRVMKGGRLAQDLMLEGQFEAARALVTDIWNEATELQKVYSADRKKVMLGEARTFAPVFSLVDLDASLKLTRLISLEDEKESGLTKALLFYALANDLNLQDLADKQNIQLTQFGFSGFFLSDTPLSPSFVHWMGKNLEAILDSSEKVQATLLVARHTPPGRERTELLAKTAEVVKKCATSYYFDHPLTAALKEIRQFDTLQSGDLDELLFVSMQHAPESFLNRSLIDVYGNYVRLLAFVDAEMARHFLQVAIDTDSWYYGHEFGSRFSNNELLKSAAWIEPEFACEVAETLSARWEHENQLNRMQLLTDMLKSLNEVRLRVK